MKQQALVTLEQLGNKQEPIARKIIDFLDEIFNTLDILYVDQTPNLLSIEFDFDTTMGIFKIKEKDIILFVDLGGIERSRSIPLAEDWETNVKKWLISLRESPHKC